MFNGEEEILIGKESLRKSTLTKLFWLGCGCLGILFVCGGMVNVWSTGRIPSVQPTASPVVYVTKQEVTREVPVTQQVVIYVTATPTPELPTTPTPELPIDAIPAFTPPHMESLVAYYPFRTNAADVTGQHPAAQLNNVFFFPPEENFIPTLWNFLDSSSTITLSHPLT